MRLHILCAVTCSLVWHICDGRNSSIFWKEATDYYERFQRITEEISITKKLANDAFLVKSLADGIIVDWNSALVIGQVLAPSSLMYMNSYWT